MVAAWAIAAGSTVLAFGAIVVAVRDGLTWQAFVHEDLGLGVPRREPQQSERRRDLRQRRPGPVVQPGLEVHQDPVEPAPDAPGPQERAAAEERDADLALAVGRRDHRDRLPSLAPPFHLRMRVRPDPAVPRWVRRHDERAHSSSTSRATGVYTSPGS